MLTKDKTDPKLGAKVAAMLVSQGIQTPMESETLPDKDKISFIDSHFTDIMTTLGLDLSDPSLCETPKRVAKMFVNEIFWGLNPNNFPKFMTVPNQLGNDMIVERDISVMSTCEHHFVTIEGRCHIGYIPQGKLPGLSKLHRVVEYFSRRPQMQERLIQQIAATLSYLLDTPDIAVIIEANHYCVRSRGVEDITSDTKNACMKGAFLNATTRAEFLSMVRR